MTNARFKTMAKKGLTLALALCLLAPMLSLGASAAGEDLEPRKIIRDINADDGDGYVLGVLNSGVWNEWPPAGSGRYYTTYLTVGAMTYTFSDAESIAIVGTVRDSAGGTSKIVLFDNTADALVGEYEIITKLFPGTAAQVNNPCLFSKTGLNPEHEYTISLTTNPDGRMYIDGLYLNYSQYDFGGDATLYSIYFGTGVFYPTLQRVELAEFAANKTSRSFTYDGDDADTLTAYPVITAFATYGSASIEYRYPTDGEGYASDRNDPGVKFPGIVEIVVTSEDGTNTETYSIDFGKGDGGGDGGDNGDAGLKPVKISRDTGVGDGYTLTGSWAEQPVIQAMDGTTDKYWYTPQNAPGTMTYTFTGAESIAFDASWRDYLGGTGKVTLFDETANELFGEYTILSASFPRQDNSLDYYSLPQNLPGNEHIVYRDDTGVRERFAVNFAKTGLDPEHIYTVTLTANVDGRVYFTSIYLNYEGYTLADGKELYEFYEGCRFEENAELYAIYLGTGTFYPTLQREELTAFATDKTLRNISYEVVGTYGYPEIAAFSDQGTGGVEIRYPVSGGGYTSNRNDPGVVFPGIVEIVVTSDNGLNTETYTIEFVYKLPKPEDTYIDHLWLDGIPLKGFDPEIFEYNVILPIRQNPVGFPEVEVFLRNTSSTYKLRKEKNSMPCKYFIDVTSIDGSIKTTYTLNLIISDGPENINYDTSYLGNSFNGRTGWIQNCIKNIVVTPEGNIHTWGQWDEGGHRLGTYDKDGNNTGARDYSVSNPYYYARRVEINGITWMIDDGKPLNLAADGGWWIDDFTAYWTEAGGLTKHALNYSIGKATAIGKTNEGLLMVADDSLCRILFFDVTDPENPVLKYTFGSEGGIGAGTPGLVHEDGYIKLFGGISGVGMDAKGNLYISSNIDNGNHPTQGANGMFSSFLWSFTLDGMGADGKFLPTAEYELDAKENWFRYSSGLCLIYDFDRSSIDYDANGFYEPEFIYSPYAVFKYDPNNVDPDKQYELYAFTLDHNEYPEDMRAGANTHTSTLVYIREFEGVKYMFMTAMRSPYVAVYRFDGLIAVPFLYIMPRQPQPKQFPNFETAENSNFIWFDSDGDGTPTEAEITYLGEEYNFSLTRGWGVFTDSDCNIWITSLSRLTKFEPLGIDSHGNLEYSTDGITDVELIKRTERDTPQETILNESLNNLGRIRYIPEEDVMYVAGWTTDLPFDNNNLTIGRYLYRYDNWSTTPTIHDGYPMRLPHYYYTGITTATTMISPISFTVEDGLLFLAFLGRDPLYVDDGAQVQGTVYVYDADTQEFLGVLTQDRDIYGGVGLYDFNEAINAVKLENGSWMLLAEEGWKGKNILYTLWLEEHIPDITWPEIKDYIAYADRLPEGAAVEENGGLTEDFWSLDYKLEKFDGTARNDATFGLAWDDENLYIGVRVMDSVPVATTSLTQIFLGDSIEIYVNADGSKSGSFGIYDAQITLGYGIANDPLYVYPGGLPKRGLMRVWQSDLVDESGSVIGYTFKIVLPWEVLNLTPEIGLQMGFDLINNNSDDGAVRNTIAVWAGDSMNFASTAKYGSLFLREAPPLPPPPENTIIVCGVSITIEVENGVAVLRPALSQMEAILSAAGYEIVFDLSGYGSVDLYTVGAWFKDVDKTITIITANGSCSVKTKTIWNNSGKEQLISVRNNKLSFKNI